MNILIFEWHNFGIEDIKETLDKKGHKYTVISTEQMRDRISPEFDSLFAQKFESGIDEKKYDCVFSFNFCPIISNNCKRYDVPYISWVYDSPQVALYSYTIINPCNYVFIFDKTQYLELKNQGINTVYYMPLAVNVDRMERMLAVGETGTQHAISTTSETGKQHRKSDEGESDISFVGSLYNEKHNFYDRLKGISDYTRGYLEAVLSAQQNIYGCNFMQQMLRGDIVEDMQKACPVAPNKYGVETVEYLYADYFLARELAFRERTALLGMLGKKLGQQYQINLYTPNATPELKNINNKGMIDYYDTMPYVFRHSSINLNISLRSIKSGVPLRAMDICGAGGFLMSNFQADFYEVLTPDEEMVMFESPDDLLFKCKYYLTHEKQRQQIAANGFGRVKECHTYKQRLDEMFDIVFR